ncbi:unnamed protein product [Dovyalis caffra]|uniref:Cytochrome P450 n=1 Tax=Dovyalis caffra TaxID=77055 RepID=A0AAV1SL09_9ROSI|nr:unnamed protein product [Dovyalis caffra]
MNFFGTPTVFLHGQAANKFIYTCDGSPLVNQHPLSVRRICGERNILELNGDEHKRVRGALAPFLKPEVLKQYVGKMDEEVRKLFEMHWHGKRKAMQLMKILTFNILSSLIIGVQEGEKRDILVELFQQLLKGVLSVPINLPFTSFNRSLQAREKIRGIIMELVHEKRAALEHFTAFPQRDLITSLLSLRNKDDSVALSDEEIVDNVLVIMIAGYDTSSSTLLTFLIGLLANDPSVHASITAEQDEIAKSKASGELLTWDDLARMKYTWRVALESLRMMSPVFISFRKVVKDFEYEGYLIPKGWQVAWSACMTHMDESIFPDPSKFDPRHFEKQACIPPYSFVAFGGGHRICPGYEFARLETLITIHYLVNRFTWKLRCPDIPFSRDPLPNFKDGLEIEIEPKILRTVIKTHAPASIVEKRRKPNSLQKRTKKMIMAGKRKRSELLAAAAAKRRREESSSSTKLTNINVSPDNLSADLLLNILVRLPTAKSSFLQSRSPNVDVLYWRNPFLWIPKGFTLDFVPQEKDIDLNVSVEASCNDLLFCIAKPRTMISLIIISVIPSLGNGIS